MSSFEINPTRIPEGTNQYSFAAPAGDLDLSGVFPSSVSVDVEMERRGRQFLLEGRVRTTGRFVCDRCLEEFEREVDGSFRVLFVQEGMPIPSDQADDEVRVIPADSMVIVLDDDVRQCIELTVPIKLLCLEECKGLCPRCGKNLNDGTCTCERDEMDPRWEPLRKLSRS